MELSPFGFGGFRLLVKHSKFGYYPSLECGVRRASRSGIGSFGESPDRGALNGSFLLLSAPQ